MSRHPHLSVTPDPTIAAKSRTTWEIVRRVSVYLKPYKGMALATMLCAILSTLCGFAFPRLTQFIIDDVISGGRGDLMTPVMLALLGAFLLRDLFNSIRIRVNNIFEQNVIYDMRREVFGRLQRLPVNYFDQRASGDLMTRVIEDVNSVERVLIDGTEQGTVARPQHKTRRASHYSGQRKRTTVKNVVVTAGGRVVLVTPTAPGRRHDKAEADRARVRLGKDQRMLGDSGFQGYQAGAAEVRTPHRKPRGRPLHWRHKRSNRKLARERVPAEHVLASVKRLGILRQPLRAKGRATADQVRLIGCALHNYRQDQRALAV